MELCMSCQRCYYTYGISHVQYLQQQPLRSYLSTQLRCGPSHVFVFRFPLISEPCNVRSVQNCANAASTHYNFPLKAFISVKRITKGAGAVSLSQFSKVSPNKRACTWSRSRPFCLLSLRVVLEYSDFSVNFGPSALETFQR